MWPSDHPAVLSIALATSSDLSLNNYLYPISRGFHKNKQRLELL